jgi:hypothetical protein
MFDYSAERRGLGVMAPRHAAPELVVLWPITLHSVSSGFPRWWRLGLAFTEVLLAAGLIVAAMTEGS